ncbi:MAG TPA: hypothetical protein VF824_09580 [Thermoanaerobaculia bacterium]|jgi:hypothetical protein
MNCDECGAASESAVCADCLRENELYAAYARTIDVPPMWDAIAWRIRPRRRAVEWLLAAALAVLVIGTMLAVLVTRQRAESPVMIAAARYESAIARIAPESGDARLLSDLDSAIDAARRDAARTPDDPLAAMRLVTAYDAKLQLLRSSHD